MDVAKGISFSFSIGYQVHFEILEDSKSYEEAAKKVPTLEKQLNRANNELILHGELQLKYQHRLSEMELIHSEPVAEMESKCAALEASLHLHVFYYRVPFGSVGSPDGAIYNNLNSFFPSSQTNVDEAGAEFVALSTRCASFLCRVNQKPRDRIGAAFGVQRGGHRRTQRRPRSHASS